MYNFIKTNGCHKGKKIVPMSTVTQKLTYLDNTLQRKWAQVHEMYKMSRIWNT